MKKSNKLSKKEIISEILLIMVIGCVLGFIYEELFYRIDYGKWVKRGMSFGPIVPIYGLGTVGMLFINKKFNKHPILVFLMSALVAFIVEYSIGWILLNIFNTRLWDYNTEMLNFGNINGFVCFRSIGLFALAGLALEYLVKPFVHKFYVKENNKLVVNMGIILGSITIIDIICSFFIKFL